MFLNGGIDKMTLDLPQTTALTPSPSSRNDTSESGSNMETEQERDVTSLSSVSTQDPAKSISAERTREIGKGSKEKNQKNEKPTVGDSKTTITEKEMDERTEYEDHYIDCYDYRSTILLNERRKKSKLRLAQSVSYIELMEERMLELERKVRKALREKTPEEENSSQSVPGSSVRCNVLS